MNLQKRKNEVHSIVGITGNVITILWIVALRNIFQDKVAKGDLVIKTRKRVDLRMRSLEVATTFFIVVRILWKRIQRTWLAAAQQLHLW